MTGNQRTAVTTHFIWLSLLTLSLIYLFSFNFSLKLSSIQFYFLVASGFAGLVFGDTFLFKSFRLIGARLGMLLMALVPAFSAVLAYLFLNEELSAVSILGIVVTLTGIIIVVVEKNSFSKSIFQISKAGILFGIFGAIGQASGLVLAKNAFEISDINGFVAAFIRLFSAVILILPVTLLLKRFKNPFKLFKKDVVAFKATITGTILGPVLGITFSLIAIANAKIGIASTLMSTMPVIMLPISRYYYRSEEHTSELQSH